MRPSRRAFLFGRRTAQTPWAAFCQRLTRVSEGWVDDHGEAAGVGQATFRPAGNADVRRARTLCAEYGVMLALAAMPKLAMPAARSVLRVDPSALNSFKQLAETDPPMWRAGPGCQMEQLAQAGLSQFSALPERQTLAEWLAGAAAAAWPPGRGEASGVYSADALLADGTSATFGPFGATGQRLCAWTMQRLVPALFQLAQGEKARLCRTQPDWPGRYRLDALLPESPAGVNLAHLLCGHGGTLVWLEHVVLFAVSPISTRRALPPSTAARRAAACLDMQVKALFDPAGLFLPATKGSP